MHNQAEGGADAMCGNAVGSCPDTKETRYTAYRRLVQVNGKRGAWENNGTECRGPDEGAGIVQPEITPQMVIEQAEALAPFSEVRVEPENRTFVHFPTNVSTDKDGDTVTVHLFGQAIAVTRTFTATFTLPDGEAVTIPGEITTTSDPYTLTVEEIQSLVTGVR